MGPDPTFGNIPLDQILAAAGVTLNPPVDNGPLAYATPQGPSAIDPSATALPDQANQAGGFYPGQPENAPPVDNSSAPMYSAAPGESYTTSQSGTHQESSRGFSPEKYAQVDAVAKAPGGIDQHLSQLSQKGDQYLNAYGQQQEVSAQAGRDAIDANTEAERAKILAQGRDSARLAAMNQANAIEESKQTALAAQRTHEYMAKYEESLQAVRGVDPRQLWDSLGSGGQIGMLGAAFAQGMFALKGVNLGVMDNWNRAVDRNINVQIENIKKGLDVADGFRKLWDMSRADSATDTEARLRVRGYMLQSFQDQVASEMAGYDSKLAAAKGQAGLAQIETELTKNKGELAQIANAKFNAEAQNATHVFATKTAAATAYQEHLDRQAALNAAKAPKPMTREEEYNVYDRVVHDPERGVVGMASVKGAEDLNKQLASAKTIQDKANALAAMVQATGPVYDSFGNRTFSPADVKVMKAALLDFQAAVAQSYGGARADASINMFKKYAEMLPIPKWTDRDAVETTVRAIQQQASMVRQKTYDEVATMAPDAPTPEEWAVINKRPHGQNWGIGTQGSIDQRPNFPPPPPNTVVQPLRHTGTQGDQSAKNPTAALPPLTPVHEISADISGKRAHDIDRTPTANPDAALYEGFRAAHPELNLPGGYHQGMGQNAEPYYEMPHWATGLASLADTIKPPESTAYLKTGEQRTARSQDVLQALQDLAGWASDPIGLDRSGTPDIDRQLFAEYLIHEYIQAHK